MRASLRRSIAVPQFARTYAVPGVLPTSAWRYAPIVSLLALRGAGWSSARSDDGGRRCRGAAGRVLVRVATRAAVPASAGGRRLGPLAIQAPRPPDGGRTDSASRPPRTRSQETIEWSSTCRRFQLIPPPDRSRYGRHQVKHPPSTVVVITWRGLSTASATSGRSPPAIAGSHSETAQAAGPAGADRSAATTSGSTPSAARTGVISITNRPRAADLEGGVVEVARPPPLSRRPGFVHDPVQPHRMPACAERKPVEVDSPIRRRGSQLRSCRAPLPRLVRSLHELERRDRSAPVRVRGLRELPAHLPARGDADAAQRLVVAVLTDPTESRRRPPRVAVARQASARSRLPR